MKIQSPSNNAFMDMGDYKLGHLSNEPFVFSYKNSNIISFDSNEISLRRNIVATSNVNIIGDLHLLGDISTTGISCSNLNTSNIVLNNSFTNGYKFLDCTSNNISTFYLTNNEGYFGGRLGIGVTPDNNMYSLVTHSNIYVNGDVCGSNLRATNMISITSNLLEAKIFFNSSNQLEIDANRVVVNNFSLGGRTSFTQLTCDVLADISGLLVASNVNIINDNLQRNPFRINQRLISNSYGNNIFGNPISVKSQHLNVSITPTIMELSSCGNLVLGDYPTLSDITSSYRIINDYVIRGYIPHEREQHFRGYVHFSSNNIEKTIFNVDKSGQVSIGSSKPSALLDIANGFTSYETNYVKPTSIMYLRNQNTSNELPFLRCENSNSSRTFHITSNSTLSFKENTINMYKYDIESDTSYLPNIDTCKIASYNTDGIIDMSSSVMSNVTSLYSCNIETSNLSTSNLHSSIINIDNGFITNLRVGTFSTIGAGNNSDKSSFAVGNDHLTVSGKNTVISHRSSNLLLSPPTYVNTLVDKLIIETVPSNNTANGYVIFGNNNQIKLLCKNENTVANSYVVQELVNSTGGFAFASRLRTTGNTPELYITPMNKNAGTDTISNDPYSNPSITIYYDKTIYLGHNLFSQITNADILNDATRSAKSVNIGDGVLVYANSDDVRNNKYLCLTTNKYGSIDTGRGIALGQGPFNKQGGWVTTTNGVYIILNADYGVRDNTSGTLHIQVQGASNKIGNASVSFLRSTGAPEIFTILRHKSASLTVFTITAEAGGIKITTDIECKVCWTSIGSC
jgi:hypothetical protein